MMKGGPGLALPISYRDLEVLFVSLCLDNIEINSCSRFVLLQVRNLYRRQTSDCLTSTIVREDLNGSFRTITDTFRISVCSTEILFSTSNNLNCYILSFRIFSVTLEVNRNTTIDFTD